MHGMCRRRLVRKFTLIPTPDVEWIDHDDVSADLVRDQP